MRTLNLPSGKAIPVLGQGTWGMGENPASRSGEIAALRLGLDLGMTLIDTAEMYGEGASEEMVGAAIAGRRNEVFLVSKFYPHHATAKLVARAWEDSLRRLKTDRLDLYLLHWPGQTPLRETLEGLQALKQAGKILEYGVSNFDTERMNDTMQTAGGTAVATDQVLYNLSRRGVEWDLIPALRKRRIPLMAYSPVEQGRILDQRALRSVASCHDATPAQVALAWILRSPDIFAIPKAAMAAHVRENLGALELTLTAEDLEELDRAFPPPKKKRSLEML